ncbi:MAG: HAD-IIB family hydrolase [Bacilli bacterium]
MSQQTFVFDLDGTICFKGARIAPKIEAAIAKLTAQGHHVIFASARPIRDMLPVLPPTFHNYTLIGGNGSLISQGGNMTEWQSFSDAQVSYIWNVLDTYEATYMVDSTWNYTYTGTNEHPIFRNIDQDKLAKNVPREQHVSVVKVLVLTANDMDAVVEALQQCDVVIHRHAHENVIDISPTGIHKWSALAKLGVQSGGYIAFGNDANDVTMFQHAGHAVRIGEHAALEAFATETLAMTDTIEERIVEWIERFVLDGAYA